jgi:hypothetical protein
MPSITDYAAIGKELSSLAKLLNISKKDIQTLTISGADAADEEAIRAFDKIEEHVNRLDQIVKKTPLTEEEAARKIAELQQKIEMKILERDQASPDSDTWLRLDMEVGWLQSKLASMKLQKSFRFEDLLDADGNAMKSLMAAAVVDVKARASLAGVLKGVELALRVAAFTGAAAAKLAVA